jgi:hypothetical protein
MMRNIVCGLGLLFASSAFVLAGTDPSSWKKGIVVSAAVNGHGPIQGADAKSYRGRQDIWWNYRIDAGCFSYSVVSRRTPSQAGLQPDKTIKFLEEKSRIHILDRDGKPLALRIVRKDRSKKCR